MLRGVWSLGGRTKIGRMNLLPVNLEYQYFLGLVTMISILDWRATHLYTQPSTKLKSMRRRATPAVHPIPM